MTHVLVVEDSSTQAAELRFVLEDKGFTVDVARDGQRGLSRLKERRPDVVLSDVVMPVLGGHAMCRAIKSDAEFAGIPVVLMTSLDDPGEVAEALECGADGFFRKPVRSERLVERVRTLVENAKNARAGGEGRVVLFDRPVQVPNDRFQVVRLLSSVLDEFMVLNHDLADANLALGRANEERAVALQRAERESQYKSKFLAGMSHELRTPLNAIIGFSELLEQEIGGTLTARQRQFVMNVHQSGRHLLSLVNDILDLSKIEAGRMELNREWTPVAGIIDAVHGVVQPLADKQGVTLIVDVPTNLPDAYIDSVRTKQILYNLLSNGIKFTPKGGSVTLVGRGAGRDLELAVTDTGIGISRDDLPRLFREFEQIEPSSGSKPEGTGLGLALTLRLVEMHGGRLRVDSEVGKGSTFTVSLPLIAGGGTSTEAPVPSSDPLATEPVALVVDDDPAAAELIAGHLRAVGLSVIYARSAEEALRLASARIITCITLDVIMPGNNGWSVLEALKRAPETAKIPVFVASVVDEINRGILLGAQGCLVKPISAETLVAALEGAGVPLHRIQVLSAVFLKKGDHRDDVEEHLRRAGAEVHRATDIPGALAVGNCDIAIVDGADATETGRTASSLAGALPGVPVLALVDPSARLTGPLPSTVKAMFRGDALRLDRLVRAVSGAVKATPKGSVVPTLRGGGSGAVS
jgi:signal transduction histidine kinase